MNLFSYIVNEDTGFAPNPFWGYCTLGNCKPKIRKTAKVNDWVVGLTKKKYGNKIIYAMKVTEILNYSQYYNDSRFKSKIPNYNIGDIIHKCGDNIYSPLPDNTFHQLRSMHSFENEENIEQKKTDLSGEQILLSQQFYYFGFASIELPSNFSDFIVGRGHKRHNNSKLILDFENFIQNFSAGIHARPFNWSKNEHSWNNKFKTTKKIKIILSRKGFDSSSGGVPSPIFPDGSILSLPIPEKESNTTFNDISSKNYKISEIVSDLTNGKQKEYFGAHLDPDLLNLSLPRQKKWKPLFGQVKAAQSHLANQKVTVGDLFLFFGLFQEVILTNNKFVYKKDTYPKHILWGWLQIDKIIQIDTFCDKEFDWAKYHPHFQREKDKTNTIYVAKDFIDIPGIKKDTIKGAGVFEKFSNVLQLTDSKSKKPSFWKLPKWFNPNESKPPLTYHSDITRWIINDDFLNLNTVGRGQEFVLDTTYYPEASDWIKSLLN